MKILSLTCGIFDNTYVLLIILIFWCSIVLLGIQRPHQGRLIAKCFQTYCQVFQNHSQFALVCMWHLQNVAICRPHNLFLSLYAFVCAHENKLPVASSIFH
ncbi:hypothetical protein KP509_06G077300 [Ceratopteris richardii]|uniref:Uncharacterized protein n=1 Tax=Ceratopteris richardii TaxID=49495 RepID=A0A8T2ULX2_CERRI|nr:hypothetical protein KP509_06G077300 [Ceratopteris richardii]